MITNEMLGGPIEGISVECKAADRCSPPDGGLDYFSMVILITPDGIFP